MSTIRTDSTTSHTPVSRGTGDAAWVRLLVWTSLLAMVADLGAPALVGEVIPPLAVGAVLTIVGLAVLRRRRRPGVAILGVTSLLLVVTGAPFALPNLVYPSSPITFLHAVTLLVRIGAVVAAVGAWRHAAPAVAKRLGTAMGALFGAAVVASGIATVTTPGESSQPGDVAVSVSDFAFVPEEVRVSAGGTVQVQNDDLIVHTFSVRDTDLSRTLHERRSVRLQVDLATGTYELFCAIPGHEFMTASLIVE